MKLLKIEKITGCFVSEQPVKIYDKRGVPFYFHKGKTDGKFFFNLPKGEFFTENNVHFLAEPVPFNLPKLPKFEKNIKPKNLVVNFENNPNKASINVFFGKITVDPEMRKKTIPEIVFILFHEYAHHFYFTESKCDLFAAREMLKMGFNSSQCNLSVIHALSENSKNRKYSLIKKINSANGKAK